MYFNPFAKRVEIQLVSSHPATHKRLFPRKVPQTAWNPTAAQLRARIAFGEFAHSNCYGKKGTVTMPDGRVISQPAYIIMTQYKPGEMPGRVSPEARRSMRHDMARANLDKLKAKLAAKS